MNTCMECYRQYIHHLKSAFPYVSAPIFNEGVINMGITNDTSDQGEIEFERLLQCDRHSR